MPGASYDEWREHLQVPCTVSFSIRVDKGLQGVPPNPWAVQPQQCTIQPYGFVYVEVTFMPDAMQRYRAELLVEVQGQTDLAAMRFACWLIGEGCLPTLMVEVPGRLSSLHAPTTLSFPCLLKVRSRNL